MKLPNFGRHINLAGKITAMPNIATTFKAEISRIARKEVRTETASLKTLTGSHRSQIAELKRRIHALELLVRRLSRRQSTDSQAGDEEMPSGSHRFSAKRLASHRRRLGLSAGDFGRLLGVTAQSIYNWEEGKARPRPTHMPAIAALRTLGRRRAVAHLESLSPAT
jgi:DNA-binding transcriptional regulator YiaG